MAKKPNLFVAMHKAVLEGDRDLAEQLAEEAVESGLDPLKAIDEGFVPGIREAGKPWEEGEYFLPELVTAAQAMAAAMDVLRPELSDPTKGGGQLGRVVIGTVAGDIHDIGKTLVATLLAANGFAVTDLGADVPLQRFIDSAREVDADMVCASALLTTTMTGQADLVKKLKEAKLRAKVLVGGAPVTQQWASEIGADGFAENAVSAVEVARNLVNNN